MHSWLPDLEDSSLVTDRRPRFAAITLLTTLVLATVGCSATSNRWTWQCATDEDGSTITVDGRELLCYRQHNVQYKPYIERFRTPDGVNILRDAPHDHLHHHGIMYAVNVDGVEFWHEAEESGTQVSQSFEATAPHDCGDWEYAQASNAIHWLGPDGSERILDEQRMLKVYVGEDLDATLLTWKACLIPADGREQVRLHGRHYFGLGMRFVESMDTGGQHFNADGATGVAATNDVKSDWCAYAASADGHPVTVAVFNDPDNPRSPARWFTMDDPFAYISLTHDLHHEELIVPAGSPFEFRAGIALWDGYVDADRVARLYRQWVALPR